MRPNETVYWHKLSDKDKVQLILHRVYNCFIVEYPFDIGNYRGQRGADAGFHWPVAWWDGDFGCWAITQSWSNGNSLSFDPLASLDDAWIVVDYFKLGRANSLANDRAVLRSPEEMAKEMLMQLLCFENQLAGHTDGWWSWSRKRLCGAICVAALRAVGLEVIDEG
jgi:hypothetical protein